MTERMKNVITASGDINVPDQIEKYRSKLIRDRTAVPDSIRFYRLDDVVSSSRADEWLPVFTEVLSGLNVTALLFAMPTLLFADLLVERAPVDTVRLLPKDSETKTFLHDIPFIRKTEWQESPKTELAGKIIRCLKERKAVIIEGLGVVASGGLTVEQAYIGYTTIFHTTFIKYLLDLLKEGFKLPGEREAFEEFRKTWGRQVDMEGVTFAELWNAPSPQPSPRVGEGEGKKSSPHRGEDIGEGGLESVNTKKIIFANQK